MRPPSSERIRYSRWTFICLGAFCAALGFYGVVAGGHVWGLSEANLAIHEVAHRLIDFDSEPVAHLLAGSVAQVAVPLVIGLVGLWQRTPTVLLFCLTWAGISLQEVSVYVADAPHQELELVGGNIHDWAWLLDHWGVLDRAEQIADQAHWAGIIFWAGSLAGCLWFALHPPFTRRMGS